MSLVALSGRFRLSLFSSCRNIPALSLSKHFSSQPNPPLDLDPSLQALLKDVDISLSRKNSGPPPPRRELEAYPIDSLEEDALLPDEGISDHSSQRKSPAAHFGSQQIGAVVLPPQLQTSIKLLISGTRYIPYTTFITYLCSKNLIEYSCIATQNASFMMKI